MLLLWLSIFLFSSGGWAFEYNDCGKKDKTIIFDELKLTPSPIPLPGEVTVKVRARVLEDIPKEAKVKLTATRKTTFLGHITLPCLGDVGSCSFPVCRYLKEHEERACPFFPEDKKCECPISSGTYEGKDITVPMADFGPLMNQMIAGEYSFKFRVVHQNKELGCLKIFMKLKAKRS